MSGRKNTGQPYGMSTENLHSLCYSLWYYFICLRLYNIFSLISLSRSHLSKRLSQLWNYGICLYLTLCSSLWTKQGICNHSPQEVEKGRAECFRQQPTGAGSAPKQRRVMGSRKCAGDPCLEHRVAHGDQDKTMFPSSMDQLEWTLTPRLRNCIFVLKAICGWEREHRGFFEKGQENKSLVSLFPESSFSSYLLPERSQCPQFQTGLVRWPGMRETHGDTLLSWLPSSQCCAFECPPWNIMNVCVGSMALPRWRPSTYIYHHYVSFMALIRLRRKLSPNFVSWRFFLY